MPLSPYLSFAGNCPTRLPIINVRWARNCSIKSVRRNAKISAGQRRELPFRNAFPDTAIAHANVRIAGSDIMIAMPCRQEKPATPALRWCSIPTGRRRKTLV